MTKEEVIKEFTRYMDWLEQRRYQEVHVDFHVHKIYESTGWSIRSDALHITNKASIPSCVESHGVTGPGPCTRTLPFYEAARIQGSTGIQG